MLKYNEVAMNINTIFSNYKYYFKRIICIDYLISSWVELLTNFPSFSKIKYKWFKFFAKTLLSRQSLNNNKIYVIGLNKFELKSYKIYTFKTQLIKNSILNIAHLFFEGIQKTIRFEKNKILHINHWIVKPLLRCNWLLNKSCHFLVSKMIKSNQNVNLLLVFKLKKIVFCNILLNKFKEQILNNLCSSNKFLFLKKIVCSSFYNLTLIVSNKQLFKNNVFNTLILDYYLIFLDHFIVDLLSINSHIFYTKFWSKYCVGFKGKLDVTIAHNLLNNFIKFNLFLSVVKKDRKINLKNNSLTLFNYLFLTSDFNSKITNLSNKMQSVQKYKHRSLIQLKEKNNKLIKVHFFKLQNQTRTIGSNIRWNRVRYNLLINKVFKKYFNPWLNYFRRTVFFNTLSLHIDLKKSPNKKLRILKKAILNAKTILNSHQLKFSGLSVSMSDSWKVSSLLSLNVFAPIKLISKHFWFFGLLSYKKNKFCANNVIIFNNYEDIIKFYSIVIIKLLLYYQMANNFKPLKTLCIKVRKSCILTLNLKYKNSNEHSLMFQRYYSFIKFKFTYKWSKLILIDTILKYKSKFLLKNLFLNFNISYIVWKFRAKNYFYNFI